MAGFEGARPSWLGEVVPQWRVGKYIPLYLAAIAAGAGLGIGISTWPASEVADVPVLAPVVSAPLTFEEPFPAPEPILPVITGTNAAAITVDLPVEFIRAMGGLPAIETAPPAPAAEAAPPSPVAPAAPIVPVAQAPAAPAAPVVQPPSAPAPAPAVQPAAQAPAPAAKPNFYVPEVSTGPATELELRLFALLNEERAAAGLAPYVLDSGLTRIARTRSQQLIDQNYFAHTDPYGYSMYVELLAHFGYTSYAWAGENLAMNNYAVSESPERATKALMNSSTHRANILAGDFTRVGIGEITDGGGRHYYTMIFLS